ncbi:dTDP-4-dehydrorhamnose reductase [Alkalicoccobacillus gibsonii]|uniref:dTDP-4-dehydrorhamnose reductase n=1 Tax=Alkalicoccobacillus gibsonii TaxID=79881 RepID=UPI001931FB59|nr:dTDP-4-dehydrorhamnose reductase [Alkalicoccobacillus gibsonii]MBM0067734.1 dTDP-4-dehydrorhamnose reductase [Alkalicoccobacillus gibsonii]
MKILITGAEGRVGKAFQIMLQNEEVFAFSKQTLDCTNRYKVTRVVEQIDPDLMIHCAAMTNVDACEREPVKAFMVNSLALTHLVEAAGTRKLMLLSSDYVFGEPSVIPYQENDTPSPQSVYAYSKWLGEELIKYHPSTYIIRTSWLFGGDGDFVDKIIQKAKEIDEITVVDDQVGTPTYIKDLVQGSIKLLQHPPGIYHFSNSGTCSRYEWAKAIVSYLPNEVYIRTGPTIPQSNVAKRPSHTILSNEKWKRVTGEDVRNWREALEEYMEGRLDDEF